jgi:ankyrin repeat protein
MNSAQKFNLELRQACISNAQTEVKRLLGERPSALGMMTPFGTWLHVAAKAGAIDIVRLLLDLGLDPNTCGGTFHANALHEAASGGHLSVMAALHEAGSILDTSEPERNPLFGAIYGGHIEAVKWLVKNGIDIGATYTGENMKGMDALAFARERGQTVIAKYLDEVGNAA